MRLLIVTQVVDENDLYLSFFTGWLTSFASRFESIEVVCLKEGVHSLPKNVHVHSLGKEKKASRLQYIARLYRYAWGMRDEYDAVFVHMNQEYVLLCGMLWTLLRKPLYLWRNHYSGSFLTDVATLFCRKVFYTSKFSYTARFSRAVRMPVGVDIERFSTQAAARVPRSILFFARFAPSKRPDVFVKALSFLKQRSIAFTGSVIGSALPQDQEYQQRVKIQARDHGLTDTVVFGAGVPNSDAPRIFSAHDIFVDLGSSGMYNKMIFEAAASGSLVLAASKDFQEEMGTNLSFHEDDASELSDRLEELLTMDESSRNVTLVRLREYTERNSLHTLTDAIAQEVTL